MKKLLTALFFAATLGGTNAEAAKTYFSEDFEKDISKTWTIIDGDKRNLAPLVVKELFGQTEVFPISWFQYQGTIQSLSMHEPAGAADDWLISPEFQIDDKAMLEWTASSEYDSYKGGYEVLVSTGSIDPKDFVKVYANEAEGTATTSRSVDLAKLGYVNQKIRVAFRNNSSQKLFLVIDNVQVTAPDDQEISLVHTRINDVPKMNEPVTITPYIKTRSYIPVKSVDVTYEVDGEEPVTNTVDISAVLFNTYKGFDLATKWTPAKLGNRTIKVTLSNINGNDATEGNTEDNTAQYQAFVWDNTNSKPVFPMIESFISSTCGYCTEFNETLNPFLNSNKENLTVIKYQMNSPKPGDPYYNNDCGIRAYYYQTSGTPECYANGIYFFASGYQEELMTSDGVALLKSDPGFYNIINPTFSIKDKTVNIKGEIESLADLTGLNVKYHVAIVEKKTTGNASTNGEKEFFNVMQKMLPNGNGTAVSALAKGAKQSIDLSYTFDAATSHVEEYDDLAAIVFVQNVNTGRIFQSAWAVQSTSSVDGNNDGNGIVALYPNPATDLVKVQYALAQDQEVSIEIVDVAGATVANVNKGMLSAGYYTEGLDINNLSSGKYFVRMNIGGKLFTDVITVSK